MSTRQPFTRLPVPDAPRSVQNALNDVYDKLAQTQSPANLQAVNSDIAAVKSQLETLQKSIASAAVLGGSAGGGGGSSSAPPTILPVIEQSHAARVGAFPAGSYPPGTLFFETNPTLTDRQSLYVVQALGIGVQWVYVSGLYAGLFSARPTDLGPADAGFRFFATNYTHEWHWTGTAWAVEGGRYVAAFTALATLGALLGTGDTGFCLHDTTYEHDWYWTGASWTLDGDSQYIVIAPSAPAGGVWYPCDGTAHTCVTLVGGTVSVTPPDYNGTLAAMFGGGFSASLVPATAPTLQTNVAIDAGTLATGNDLDAGITFLAAGVGSTAAVNPHTHPITGAPAVTQQPVLNTPTLAHGGLPDYFQMSFWLRA